MILDLELVLQMCRVGCRKENKVIISGLSLLTGSLAFAPWSYRTAGVAPCMFAQPGVIQTDREFRYLLYHFMEFSIDRQLIIDDINPQ